MHRFDIDILKFISQANSENWKNISISLGVKKHDEKIIEYIREKNHYRFGGIGASSFKISYGNTEYDNLFDRYLSQVNNIFKMKFEILESREGLINDDFIKDLITIRFTFKRIWSR